MYVCTIYFISVVFLSSFKGRILYGKNLAIRSLIQYGYFIHESINLLIMMVGSMQLLVLRTRSEFWATPYSGIPVTQKSFTHVFLFRALFTITFSFLGYLKESVSIWGQPVDDVFIFTRTYSFCILFACYSNSLGKVKISHRDQFHKSYK